MKLLDISSKAGRFEPEYLGKLNLYLEALDRDVRKAHSMPSSTSFIFRTHRTSLGLRRSGAETGETKRSQVHPVEDAL
jgi:hypothetical protein